MRAEIFKRFAIFLAVVVITAIALSVVWAVPYIFTIIGFAAWVFVGHLITVDDDVPGGWSNPDGSLPFPWAELAIKGVVLAVACGLAAFLPAVRTLGGAS